MEREGESGNTLTSVGSYTYPDVTWWDYFVEIARACGDSKTLSIHSFFFFFKKEILLLLVKAMYIG